MSQAFEQWASQNGVWAKSVNGDAFSHQVKKETADIIASEMGKVDLIVYSLAIPDAFGSRYRPDVPFGHQTDRR